MYNNPLNLAVRFGLEIAALVAMAIWGWKQHHAPWKLILAIGIPLLAAAIWGIFRVDNDPGKAPVVVPGIVRLLIEGVFFAAALWMWKDMGYTRTFWIMLALLVLHYGVSYDRVLRMLG